MIKIEVIILNLILNYNCNNCNSNYVILPGARERFLLRGGPTNKKNEILIIFKKFTL